MTKTKTEIIRITTDAKRHFDQIARSEGKPMIAVVDEAADYYRREVFFRRANAAYLQGRLDTEERRREKAEAELLDGSLMDGLEDA